MASSTGLEPVCLLTPQFEWCTALNWSHKEKKILPSSCLEEKALQLRQSFTPIPSSSILGHFSGAENRADENSCTERNVCRLSECNLDEQAATSTHTLRHKPYVASFFVSPK